MCSGKGLQYAEIFRNRPHVRPLCLLIKREVTWEGEVLDTPPDISESAQSARNDYPEWADRYEQEVRKRGKDMANSIMRLNSDEDFGPYDPDGFQVAVVTEWRAHLLPFMAQGLSLTEAAEHFVRMHSQTLPDEITEQLVLEHLDRSIDQQ